MASVQYDPGIIEKFASRLYSRARSLVVVYGIVGFVLGATGAVGSRTLSVGGDVLGFVVLIFGTLIGAAYGLEKGFMLRLQAQQALCQVEIERNTRGAGAEISREQRSQLG